MLDDFVACRPLLVFLGSWKGPSGLGPGTPGSYRLQF